MARTDCEEKRIFLDLPASLVRKFMYSPSLQSELFSFRIPEGATPASHPCLERAMIEVRKNCPLGRDSKKLTEVPFAHGLIFEVMIQSHGEGEVYCPIRKRDAVVQAFTDSESSLNHVLFMNAPIVNAAACGPRATEGESER